MFRDPQASRVDEMWATKGSWGWDGVGVGAILGVGPVVGALVCLATGKLESHLLVNGKSLEKNSMAWFWVVFHIYEIEKSGWEKVSRRTQGWKSGLIRGHEGCPVKETWTLFSRPSIQISNAFRGQIITNLWSLWAWLHCLKNSDSKSQEGSLSNQSHECLIWLYSVSLSSLP